MLQYRTVLSPISNRIKTVERFYPYLRAMKILDGKLASRTILDRLKIDTAQLSVEGKKVPHLAAVLVGSHGASETYVAAKIKACSETGFKSTLVRFEEDVNEIELIDQVQELNADPEIDGVLVQLPLPKHISEVKLINAINPAKDVDGFHPISAGRMLHGTPGFLPATPYGIMLLIEHYKIDTRGMNAVIIGRSNIVGRPMSVLLSANNNPGNCTVTICHSQTRDLKDHCLRADLLVAAMGRPGFITADMVKEGAIVIDVGITRVADPSRKTGFSLKGDVAYEKVAPKTSFITPVPGGVGPMTIAALMKNTFRSCIEKND